MAGGRKPGALNKSSLNITKYIRDSFTTDDCDLVVRRIRELLASEDFDIAFKTIKLFLERFTLSADKLVEAVTEDEKIVTKEQFDQLLRGLLDNEQSTTETSESTD